MMLSPMLTPDVKSNSTSRVVIVILSLALSVILLIVTWQLISYWQLNQWQQAVIEKIAEDKKHQKAQPKQTPTKLANIENKPQEDLALLEIDLPSLAKVTSPLPDKQQKQSITTKTRYVKDKHAKAITSPSQVQLTDQHKPKRAVKATVKQTAEPNKVTKATKSVAAMYQQLISDDSIDIEIAWPENSRERQDTFTFLYQCIGMKFGVLHWQQSSQQVSQQKVTLAKNPYLQVSMDNNRQQVSDWLRIAQGQLAKQEQYWLQKYALSGTPVRLFPKALDWQLASLLTQQLNNTALTSFRARYQHRDDRFMLTNISINGRLLTSDWTLLTSNCSI